MSTDKKITPLFDFNSSKNSILLHRGVAELCIKDISYTGDGEARLELLPKANIVCSGKFERVDPHHGLGEIFTESEIVSFSIDSEIIDGFSIGNNFELVSQLLDIRWIPISEPVRFHLVADKETNKIVFHLFNFEDFDGAGSSLQTEGNNRKRISHFALSWKSYQITVQSVFSVKDNITTLKNEGGYRLTQFGKIEKSDRSSIKDDEIKNLLDALRYFISFAKGSWCNPVCPVGLDENNNKTWYLLNSPDRQWQSLSSWFDTKHADALEVFFPIFMKLWEEENWKGTMEEVLYWYFNANDPGRGVDAGLILAQAALERLSYEYVVNEKKLLSPKGFKDIWASDKYRLLFSSLNIPLTIPSQCTSMLSASNQYNWLDAPHALTEVRNALVHPEHKKHGQIKTDIFIEAWNLSLWYLEMTILAIAGYKGTYANRLIKQRWVGSVENVPWSR